MQDLISIKYYNEIFVRKYYINNEEYKTKAIYILPNGAGKIYYDCSVCDENHNIFLINFKDKDFYMNKRIEYYQSRREEWKGDFRKLKLMMLEGAVDIDFLNEQYDETDLYFTYSILALNQDDLETQNKFLHNCKFFDNHHCNSTFKIRKQLAEEKLKNYLELV